MIEKEESLDPPGTADSQRSHQKRYSVISVTLRYVFYLWRKAPHGGENLSLLLVIASFISCSGLVKSLSLLIVIALA